MKALIWKELREHRLLIIAALVLILLAEIAFLVFGSEHRDSHLYFYGGFRCILPVLFALGASSSVFSGEFGRRTQYFLLSKPYDISGIFIIKFLTGLFVAIFATVVSVSVFELNKYEHFDTGSELV
jgi:ABC-type transport system involved in multi-copper enzyme maturation permease subunit